MTKIKELYDELLAHCSNSEIREMAVFRYNIVNEIICSNGAFATVPADGGARVFISINGDADRIVIGVNGLLIPDYYEEKADLGGNFSIYYQSAEDRVEAIISDFPDNLSIRQIDEVERGDMHCHDCRHTWYDWQAAADRVVGGRCPICNGTDTEAVPNEE